MNDLEPQPPFIEVVVVNQYPFHLLPKIPNVRELTDEEKELLQSSFAWMQTSDRKIPRPTTASYSELCFLLLNLEQMRVVTKIACFIYPHKEKYEAIGQKHGFYEILYYDFFLLEEFLFNCAEYKA